MGTGPVRGIEVPPAVWTGRLKFDLPNRYRWSVATLEIIVRLDTITLWCADHVLAVLDRDQFARWLGQPDHALDVDDVTWSTAGGRTFITIDGSIPYVVPDIILEYLTAAKSRNSGMTHGTGARLLAPTS